ncbi:WGR domain-containing protein [Ochrobactrum sp. S1502_03]|uniref:WGR domain-containing protein n=1 Tax=Ochrobactrum sp. S1502_03 TaxID=3108451 RepID=UPI0037C8F422
MESRSVNYIKLYRVTPEQNMARFYGLSVERDLFGVWIFTRNWGRIGSRGQFKHQSFETEHAAIHMLNSFYTRKLRRGYHL